jgi:predicted small metal-binding protein
MAKRISIAFFTLLLAVAFSTLTLAQEKQEMKKETKSEMTKSEKPMAMHTLSCDNTCGFMVRSHDEKEAMSIMKNHAKKAHKMDMTDKQMQEMMKTEGGGEMKK